MEDFISEKIMPVVLAALLIVALILLLCIPFLIYRDWSKETYDLKKENWECSSTYTHKVFTGKVWVNREDCSQYSLRGSN